LRIKKAIAKEEEGGKAGVCNIIETLEREGFKD
jgi:hypothetical protein